MAIVGIIIKMKKETIKTTIMIVLAIAVGLMICIHLSQGYIGEKQTEAFNYGYELALTDVITGVSQCEPLPLTYDNQTINLIAIECLQENKQ